MWMSRPNVRVLPYLRTRHVPIDTRGQKISITGVRPSTRPQGGEAGTLYAARCELLRLVASGSIHALHGLRGAVRTGAAEAPQPAPAATSRDRSEQGFECTCGVSHGTTVQGAKAFDAAGASHRGTSDRQQRVDRPGTAGRWRSLCRWRTAPVRHEARRSRRPRTPERCRLRAPRHEHAPGRSHRRRLRQPASSVRPSLPPSASPWRSLRPWLHRPPVPRAGRPVSRSPCPVHSPRSLPCIRNGSWLGATAASHRAFPPSPIESNGVSGVDLRRERWTASQRCAPSTADAAARPAPLRRQCAWSSRQQRRGVHGAHRRVANLLTERSVLWPPARLPAARPWRCEPTPHMLLPRAPARAFAVRSTARPLTLALVGYHALHR